MKENHYVNHGLHPYHAHHPQHHELYGHYGHHHISAGADDPLDVLDDLDNIDIEGLNTGYLQALVQLVILGLSVVLQRTTFNDLLDRAAEFSAQEDAKEALIPRSPTS